MSPVQDSQSVQEINAGFDAVMAVVKKYEALAPFFYRGAIENEVASAVMGERPFSKSSRP